MDSLYDSFWMEKGWGIMVIGGVLKPPVKSEASDPADKRSSSPRAGMTQSSPLLLFRCGEN